MATTESRMSFLEPWAGREESPYVRGKVEEGFPRQNFENLEYAVRFRDARPDKAGFELDTHGFAFHDDGGVATQVVDAIRENDRATVQELYYPAVEAIVKAKTGASRVIIFDHTYRKRYLGLDPGQNQNGKEQPATLAHVDQSEIGAIGRVKRHALEDADRLLKGRVQVINVWRPIHGVVEDWALAVSDYRSVKESEIHPTDIFRERRERSGQTVSVNYSDDQRWYYLGRQNVDEVTLIKIWDSKDGVAKTCPHGSFPDPHAPASALPRESIEVRCLVFHE
ncbi:methyltransferase [Xylaria palmicola]|nr:methyltransferase [Xylaria palmicola]